MVRDGGVAANSLCAVCHGKFSVGERVSLVPMDPTEKGGTVRALPAHARCVFLGMKVPLHGEVIQVKDGDGSPYPIVLTDGTQWKVEELEGMMEQKGGHDETSNNHQE